MSNRALTLMMGFVAALIVVVGAVLVIALLGDGDDSTAPPARSGTPGTTRFCRDNVLITFGADPASVLDPIQVRDEGTAEYVVEIFGGLVTLDLDMKVVPDIAESWEVSPDGLTYTFRLRDDVVFHNGRRVTAEDFKYSFERAADPANASPTVLLYLSNIVGVRERYNNQASEVSGVQVVDERTLQIRVRQPTSYFLAELTYPVAFVVDREQVERDPRNWTRRPNGTGPYRVKEFVPGQRIVLVRNERYHLGMPKLEEVRFDLSGGSLLTRYENNEIHIALVPAIELGAIKEGRSPLANEYVPNPRMAFTYLAFNAKQPPFDDPKVRQALALTVDRERINDVLLFGTQRPADGILPPEMPGYDESVSGYPYDPERAKQLLAESRYAQNIPRIVLTYAGAGGEPPDVLLAIQENWRQLLGVQVELQATEYSAFLRELRRGTFQAFSAGWIADYPDPEDFLDKLFHSQSPQNEMGYRNPEVDRILEQARGETNQERRFQLYHRAERLILEDAVVIPLFWPVEHQLVKPCVKNWPVVPMTVPKYRYIEIRAD